MPAPYYQLLQSLRQAFPQPVSDRVHDAYVVFSFMRALDRVDGMKSQVPMLGETVELDYAAARRRRIADDPQTLEQVSDELVEYLSGMFIWGHPKAQINVVPAPTIPSIIGGLLPAIYNPNLVSEESSRRFAVAEAEVTAMAADLVGYNAEAAGGVFTFGGTGTLLYGAKIGLEKACPGTARDGIRDPAVIVCSKDAHYACSTVASWLGLGQSGVVRIPTNPDHEMRVPLLETQLRELFQQGRKVAAIVATMGTTDAFGLDDLKAIHALRDRLAAEYKLDYRPHIHADAVIGWAWSVFDDYDFDDNPLEFPHRTLRALAGTARRIRQLHLADSLGIDFHKTGFAPYVSSLYLSRSAADLKLIQRDDETMPYLFQSGEHHPGKYTLETTRSGSGVMAALANLMLFGKQGLRSILGHVVSMAEVLRDHLEGHAATTVLNRGNFGPVTLFRAYPDGVDTFSMPRLEQTEDVYREQLLAHNAYNRRIYELVHDDALRGEGAVLSLTDCYRMTDYGEPIVALKSYIMSPFSEPQYVDAVLESIWKARERIGAG